MLAIIFGSLFIIGGVGWFVMAAGAASMASRQVTTWESLGAPSLGIIPIALGVAMLAWG